MARPKNTSHPRKTKVVAFRLSTEGRDNLVATAAKADTTMTNVITASLEGSSVKLAARSQSRTANTDVTPFPPEVLAELHRIGSNVNQIAHAINSGLPPEPQHAHRQAARLMDILASGVLSPRCKPVRPGTLAHNFAQAALFANEGIEVWRG